MCAGHTVKVYSTTSHELVHLLEHHEDQVTACCINPSNTLQVSVYVCACVQVSVCPYLPLLLPL